MTRFLANENVPRASILALQLRGVDVVWIRDVAPGVADRTVLTIANEADRIILTFDHDYGDLVFRHRLSAPGIVLFRLPELLDLAEPARIVLDLLDTPTFSFLGNFVVASRNSVRITSMPTTDL